jgi:hypothetical protein
VRYYATESYLGNIGSFPVGLANTNLSWQKKYDQNIGLDFALLNRKLSGRFEYYTSTTTGMLTDITAPPSMGFATYRENLGDVENKGVEAMLNWRVWNNAKRTNFVSVHASIAHNKNTMKKISESLRAWNDQQDANIEEGGNIPAVRFVEGQSMSAIWAVQSRGIDPANGRESFVRKNGDITYNWSAEDQVVIGDALPKITGIGGVNVEFYNFTLNVVAEYRLGGQIYNHTLVNRVENANLHANVDKRVSTDRWMQEGDMARFKAITDQSLTRPTSRFVEDNNVLTLRSINLTYDFRDFAFLKKSFIQRMRASVFLNDIATLSSVKIERGIDYPFARNISFALQLTF